MKNTIHKTAVVVWELNGPVFHACQYLGEWEPLELALALEKVLRAQDLDVFDLLETFVERVGKMDAGEKSKQLRLLDCAMLLKGAPEDGQCCWLMEQREGHLTAQWVTSDVFDTVLTYYGFEVE